MAANQCRVPSLVMGWPAGNVVNNSQSLALSAAATWLAFQIVTEQTKTLSKVKLFMVTKTGAPTTAGCTCDLYSDAGGIPNASTEGPIAATSIGASGTWVEWAFAGTSVLAADTPFWLVFKNGTATPASNFPTYQWAGATAGGNSNLPIGAGPNAMASGVMYGWNKVHTLNSGTAWASGISSGVLGLRVEYTDGTFDGLPVSTVTRPSGGGTADRAFGKQEVGVRFDVPAGATLNVRGLSFPLAKISTPGALRFRLYSGTTLLGTTGSIPAASVTTSLGEWYGRYFSSALSISSAGNPYRAVFGDATAGDANTVGYNGAVFTVENGANSLALKPMNGTLQKTVIADNTAVSPVDTSTDILPFALLLDTLGEFTAAAGGTTIIVVDD